MTSAFEEHAEWVRSLRASAESLRDSQRGSEHGSERVDLPGEAGGGSNAGGQFDGGVMADELAPAFDRALDFQDFDDEPVYRTLGLNLYGYGSDHSQDFEVGHEPALYRSFDYNLSGDDYPAENEVMGSDWLATMPPLVHRQDGRVFG